MTSSLKHVRNPVVDRLMGKESQSAGLVPSNLRNDSYYMATHQVSFNSNFLSNEVNSIVASIVTSYIVVSYKVVSFIVVSF